MKTRGYREKNTFVEVNCSTCLAPIQRPRSVIKRAKNSYCNNECKCKNNPPVRVPELTGRTLGSLAMKEFQDAISKMEVPKAMKKTK